MEFTLDLFNKDDYNNVSLQQYATDLDGVTPEETAFQSQTNQQAQGYVQQQQQLQEDKEIQHRPLHSRAARPGVIHMEAQHGRGFPPRWLWAQGHVLSVAGKTVSFVLAGGDLPHALSPPLPMLHQFVFSFRSDGVSVTVDPWNPPLPIFGIKETPDGCAGTLDLELSTATHIIQVKLSSTPAAFSPVPCPSDRGFTRLSVESFLSKAHIIVYKRGLIGRAASRVSSWLAKACQWLVTGTQVKEGRQGRDKQRSSGHEEARAGDRRGSARWWGATLVADIVFDSAALEFGGTYRCGDYNDE